MAIGSLVAGCGGDDSADAEQIDKATFVKQADKICEQTSGKMAAQLTSVTKRESANPDSSFNQTQIAISKEVLIPGLEEELQKIRALGIPREAKKEVEALLGSYVKAIARTKANPGAGLEVEGNIAPHEAVAVAATRLGVTECPVSAVEN